MIAASSSLSSIGKFTRIPNRVPGIIGPPTPTKVISPQKQPLVSTIRCVLVLCSAVRRDTISQAGGSATTVSWASVASDASVDEMYVGKAAE